MKCLRAVLLLAVSMSLSSAAFAQEAQMYFQREAVGVKSYPAAPRLVQRARIAPTATLPAAVEAVPEQIEAVKVWNQQGKLPARNGITRSLGETVSIQFGGLVAKS